MVAVTVYHTYCPIDILGTPGGVVRYTILPEILPVLVTLDVGLIHTIETIVIKHCIHLCLTRIVTGAYDVHITLLHHLHIFEHCFNIYATAIQRMSILCIGTLEEYALAVYKHHAVLYFDLAETILCRENHFVGSCCTLLAHHYRVKVWCFGSPGKQACKIVECYCSL